MTSGDHDRPTAPVDPASTADSQALSDRIEASIIKLREGGDLERIVFFSDAVFAIAMTLLVLELRVPETPDIGADAFAEAVAGRVPAFVAFVVSFFLIGRTWITHHRRFRAIVAYDSRLQAYNLSLLFFVAFMPVPSGMLFQPSGRSAIPPILYAVTIIGMFGTLNLVWWHAHRAGLLEDDLSDPLYRLALRGLYPTLVVFALSIPIAVVNPDIAEVAWLAVWPAAAVVGRWLHRRFVREETARLQLVDTRDDASEV